MPSNIEVSFSDGGSPRSGRAGRCRGRRTGDAPRRAPRNPSGPGDDAHGEAARPGTLPQSRYFTHSSWFGGGPAIIDAEAARALAEAEGYRRGTRTLISFCNTGHWAATNWFALSGTCRDREREALPRIHGRSGPTPDTRWRMSPDRCAGSGGRYPMPSEAPLARPDASRRIGRVPERALLIALALAAAFAVGRDSGRALRVLLLIGLGFGITLEGLRFGFAAPGAR